MKFIYCIINFWKLKKMHYLIKGKIHKNHNFFYPMIKYNPLRRMYRYNSSKKDKIG